MIFLYDLFNLNEIPETLLFGNESWKFVNVTIDKLEQGWQDQSDIDAVYSTWSDYMYIKANMFSCIPYKRHYPGRNAKKNTKKTKTKTTPPPPPPKKKQQKNIDWVKTWWNDDVRYVE